MRVSLIKYGKIYNTILPSKIEGSFWIEDKDFNNNRRNLINIEAKDNKWELKSNYETKIIYNNNYVDSLYLEKYMFYELKIIGEEYNYIIYCSDVYDEDSIFLKIKNNSSISIGNAIDNTINYNNKYITSKQCIIECNNNNWVIKNLNNNAVVFVNSNAIINQNLNIGDVIFIMGLKIIFFKEYIIINSNKNIIDYNKNILEKFDFNYNVDESKIENIDNIEIQVYDKPDYYYRIPRFKTNIKEETINIDAPPQQENEDEIPLIYTLGPMMTMGISSLVTGVTALSNVLGGTQTVKSALPTLITSVAMLLTMILWPLLQKKYSQKQKKKREIKRIEQYKKYLKKKSAYIQNEINNQKQILYENNKSLEDCKQVIMNKTRNFWERKIEHDDFLLLRLGIGNIPSKLTISYPEEHFSIIENNLRNELENLGNSSKIIEQVPVTIDFKNKYISAILSRDEYLLPFFYGLLLRIISYHSYEDLKIVILTNKDYEHKWEIFKNTPYCFSEKKDIRFFSTDLDEANQISMYLDIIFKNRQQFVKDNKDDKYKIPYYLIISDNYQLISNLEIIKDIIDSKQNNGFSLMLLQDRLLGLPNECQAFINIDPIESGIFENELSKDNQQTFKPDFLENIDLKLIIKKISNIPMDTEFSTFNLPPKFGFLEMYNVGKVEQLNINNRWQMNNPIISLQVPVGIDSNGEILKLDLHEKVHGPHGLIAGMTGSGKSEFIITYVLSMAINYNPEEVSFVLIDYKGGGLTGAFENKETGIILPHLAGTITNLDINDMNRALASIESELKRRQKIFNEARQKFDESTIDIYKYQKLRREGKVEEPVPHLFIICDEFAELKVQQPDFMDELISTARIGRSLGVHLILATQKPSGIVNDQILSNTRFRICLKVQDKNDSMDMIKIPDAAMIQNVGRFFLQVGYNELFQIAQSAYAGVPYQNTDKIKKKIDTNINFIDNVGNILKSINVEDRKTDIVDYGDELINIVKYIYNLSKTENVFAKKLWLNKIPDKIYIDELKEKYKYKTEKFVLNPIVGEYDDPNNQLQNLLTIPLSYDGNAIIYGTAGSGKEQMLSAIIYSLITCHTSEEVNIYILDFGSESLKKFINFPQVGDILFLNDNEKLQNFIKKIRKELFYRKKVLSSYGGNYIEYCKNSTTPLPNIVVIINLYEGLSENDFELQDTFVELTRDCSKYGINFVISTTGTNTVRYKLKQNFKQSLILQLSNEVDYLSIIGNTHGKYPSKIIGRGLVKIKDIYEFQTALITREENAQEYLEKLGKEYANTSKTFAPRIPNLPGKVNMDSVINSIKGYESIPIGIEKDSLNVSLINLKERPINIVYSDDVSNFKLFIEELAEVINYNKNISLNILDAEKLLNSDSLPQNYYQNNFDGVLNELYNYSKKLSDVYNKNNYNLASIEKSQQVIVIIVGFSKLLTQLSKENNQLLENIFELIKNLGKIGFIIFDTPVNMKKHEFKSWFTENSLSNNGIWIGNNISSQFILRLSKVTKELREDIGEKFGYNVKNSTPKLIKLIQSEDNEGD